MDINELLYKGVKIMKYLRAIAVLVFFPYFALRNRKNSSKMITKADIISMNQNDAA